MILSSEIRICHSIQKIVSINNIVTHGHGMDLRNDTIVIQNIILDVIDLTMVKNASEKIIFPFSAKNLIPESQISEKEASKMTESKTQSSKRPILLKM
jgi:hypothetical protein